MTKLQVGWYPEGQTAECKGHGSLGKDIEGVGTRLQEIHVISHFCSAASPSRALSDAWVLLKEAQERQDQPRWSHDKKGPTPSEMNVDQSAQNVTEGASHRNRRKENRQDPPARSQRKEVSDQRRRRWSVPSLADADKNTGQQEHQHRRGQSGRTARQAPDENRRSDDEPARKTVCQETENGRGDHIANNESRTQQAGPKHGIRIRRIEKCPANFRLDRRQDITIDVVKKINAEQQQESTPGARHLSVIHWRQQLADCSRRGRNCKS